MGEDDLLTDAQIATLLEIAKSEGGWPLTFVVRQLDRYLDWWGTDDAWKLPDDVLQRARAVRDALA